MWKRIAFMITLALAIKSRGSDRAWLPPARPDRAANVRWSALGCRQGTIEVNCWIGEIQGHVCQWQRSSERGAILREELYAMSGQLTSASETLLATNEHFAVVFFDEGSSYYRLSEIGVSRRTNQYTLDVVIHGHEFTRYGSAWDPFAISADGTPAGVPMDAHVVSGSDFAAIRDQRYLADERAISALLAKRKTSSIAVDFGFWFDSQRESRAVEELASLGCRWLSVADRAGRVGPFPGLCAKSMEPNAHELQAWHKRFTTLAQKYGGRYYGWTEE